VDLQRQSRLVARGGDNLIKLLAGKGIAFAGEKPPSLAACGQVLRMASQRFRAWISLFSKGWVVENPFLADGYKRSGKQGRYRIFSGDRSRWRADHG
jgi:hypothetical protein